MLVTWMISLSMKCFVSRYYCLEVHEMRERKNFYSLFMPCGSDVECLCFGVVTPFVQTYSESKGHNFTLTADFKDVNADSYDALVVPGGRAPEYLSLDEDVLNLVKQFESSHKPIASICHGQLILAAAGVLKDKQCTAYPAVKPVVVAAG